MEPAILGKVGFGVLQIEEEAGKMKNKYFNVIIIAIVAFAFYIMNASLPFVMDDALYAHIYPSNPVDNGQPHCLDVNNEIHTFVDVLESQWNHYFTKNGRGLTHIFVQTFCGILGKPLYNIIATLIFIVFVVMMKKIFCPWMKNEYGGLAYLFPLFVFFFLIPEPTCLWDGIAYGVNYLWASTWTLAFAYIMIERKDEGNPGVLLSLLGCLVAVLVGWSHEGLVIPLGAALLWHVCQRKWRMKYYEWIWLSLFVIAAMLLVFAPSNFSRAGGMNESDWAGGALMLRMRAFGFVRGFYVCVIVALLLLGKSRNRFVDFVKDNQCWIFAWLVAVLFILLVGVLNARSTFGIDFFSVLLLCRLMGYFDISDEKIRPWMVSSSIVFLVALGNVVYWQCKAGEQYREIDRYLEISTSSDALAVVEPVNVPYFFKRYVARYKFEEPWEDWEERVARFKFNKEKVIIASSNNFKKCTELIDLLDEDHNVFGNNTFYRIGNYLVSAEPLSSNIHMIWMLGKYQAYDIISAAKKCASLVKKTASDSMEVYLSVRQINFQGHDYWIVDIFPNQEIKIKEKNMVDK